MQKKKSSPAQRAWSLLGLGLLWARKGGILKRQMVELRGLMFKYLKTTGHSRHRDNKLRFGEREFSFDKTPIYHVKMHRPASLRFLIPCITPQIDFDYDFEDDDDDDDNDGGGGVLYMHDDYNDGEAYEGEIDARAEEFIANFYEQIKLQGQIL